MFTLFRMLLGFHSFLHDDYHYFGCLARRKHCILPQCGNLVNFELMVVVDSCPFLPLCHSKEANLEIANLLDFVVSSLSFFLHVDMYLKVPCLLENLAFESNVFKI